MTATYERPTPSEPAAPSAAGGDGPEHGRHPLRGHGLGRRFAFGAVISAVAGLIGERWGPAVGGIFLAFPAILPASLTLVELHDGRRRTSRYAAGAILGGGALGAFALVAHLMLDRSHPAVALACATAAWVVTAGVAYLIVGRRLDASRDEPGGRTDRGPRSR